MRRGPLGRGTFFRVFFSHAFFYMFLSFLEAIWDLESILGLILAHPSGTCLEKQRSETEGVRHGTFADAHPPSQNAVFEDKCRKGVPKSSPESTFPRKNLLKRRRELNPRKSRICCFDGAKST